MRTFPGVASHIFSFQLQESFEKNGLKPGDDLEPRLRELQLSTLLHGRCTRQALLSLARAGEVTPADGDRAPKLVTNRFWALLQARQLKTFKRDIKLGTSLTGRDLSTFEFMRANVEYLKVRLDDTWCTLATPVILVINSDYSDPQ